MLCKNCGNYIPDDMKFCSQCGTPAGGQDSGKNRIADQTPLKNVAQARKSAPKEYWEGQPPKNIDLRSSSVTQSGIQITSVDGNYGIDPGTGYVLPDNSVPDSNQTVQGYSPVFAGNDSVTYLQDSDTPSGVPSVPPKDKKKLVLIVVAVALVILILASVTAVGVMSAMNKSQLNADGVTYVSVDDFPVLKKETELIVYDEKDFPAEEYGIKVERFVIGGILRHLNITEEVFTDESSASSYYLNLDDGEYRITLVDISSGGRPHGELNDERVIIIDVIVNNEDPDAANRVDINANKVEPEESSENTDAYTPVLTPEDPTQASDPTQPTEQVPAVSVTQNNRPEIEATEDDFEDLADILLAINFTEYDSRSATTAYAVDYMLTGEVASWGYDYFYKDILRNPVNSDPEGRFGTNYRVMNASNVEWICRNVLNINFDTDYSSSKSYVRNGNVYRKSLPASENVNYFATLSSYKVVNGKYEVTGEYYSAPVGTNSIDERSTLVGKFIITAELRTINGREQWSIYSIERV